MNNIYIVDDEEDIAELIAVNLQKNNYNARKFFDGGSFFKALKEKKPDLIILDLMLPDIDGIEICKRIKNDNYSRIIPVLMLTAKRDEIDKVLGLEVGADDYVTKPFSLRELLARVKALLRRSSYTETDNNTASGIMNIDEKIFLDSVKYEVYDNNKKMIYLTNTEFKLLKLFIEKRGIVYTRDQLLNQLWGEEKYVIDRTIDVHIKNLREKIGEIGSLIVNIRGVGYKLDFKK